MNKSKIFKSLVWFVVLIVTIGGVYLFVKIHASEPGIMPYGIWQSSDPNLTLYIEPDEEMPKGLYVTETEEIEVFAIIDIYQGNALVIYDKSAMSQDSIHGGDEYEYFNGSFTVKGEQIIYSLSNHSEEMSGYKKIIFEKIGTYSIPLRNRWSCRREGESIFWMKAANMWLPLRSFGAGRGCGRELLPFWNLQTG
jgi:hypothetical protein